MRKYTWYIFSAFLVLTCCACNSSDDLEIDDALDGMTEVDKKILEQRIEQTKKIFYAIPSPLETASIFEQAGMEYNKSLLNPIENASKYNTTFAKAINLGVYGSNLSFTSIFSQTQESMFYMNCAQKLSDGIGISDIFNEKLLERMESNINNRDSLSEIISETYWEVDLYLKENNRQSISALIIFGGWIEGLYLGCSMINEKGSSPRMEKVIAEQKYSFESLLDLMKTYEKEDLVKPLMLHMQELKPLFDAITEIKEKPVETTGGGNGIATIVGGKKLNYNTGQLVAIKEKITAIRNQLIKP